MFCQGQPRVPDSQPEVDHDRWHHDHKQQPHKRRDSPGALGNMNVSVEDPRRCDKQPREHPAALLTEVLILFLAAGWLWQVYPLQLRTG